MRKHYTLRALALGSVCLAPLAAAAQDLDLGGPGGAAAPKEYNNEIDIGVRYQNTTSPLYGRLTGNDSKGFGSLGGFRLKGGDAWDSGKTWYFQATGTDLNFSPNHEGPNNALAPEASVNVRLGQQGLWGARAYYDAITYTGQTFYTPYSTGGNLAPGLLPYGGQNAAGTLPASATRANAYYVTHPFPMYQDTAGTRRDIGGAGGKYILGNWSFGADFRHEHKEGFKVQTVYSFTGGVAFPQVIDYDTDRYNVAADFATRRLQAQLGYTYSKFTDNNWAMNLPWATTGSTAAQLTAQYLLPPSNDAHYVNGSIGYNINSNTRATGSFRYGVESSSENIGSGTGTTAFNAANAALYAPGLNQNIVSDQMTRVYNGNAQITSRPLPKLDLKATYNIDGHEVANNPMPFWESGHAENSGGYTLAVIQNQSWTKQRAAVEAGYRLVPSTKLTLGYAYDDLHRDAGNAVGGQDSVGYWVGHSVESTLWVKLANSSFTNINESITYEHAVRAGNYEYTVEPESGAYYQTPRTADRVKLRADYTPNGWWNLGLAGKLEANNYHYLHEQTGTQRDYNASIGPDITFTPSKALALHGFYTYEEVFYDNRGNGPVDLNSGYGWDAKTTDSIHTAGLSADWKVSDRLKFGANYVFSYGDIGYELYNGLSAGTYRNGAGAVYTFANLPYLNVRDLPNIESSMHSIKLNASYQLTDAITLLAGYGFDMYKDNDWAYGWSPVVISSGALNSLTSGESQNSYRVHSVYTGARLKF